MERLVTSIETRIVLLGNLALLMKVMKSVASFRYNFCFRAISCTRRRSTKQEPRSVAPLIIMSRLLGNISGFRITLQSRRFPQISQTVAFSPIRGSGLK